MLVKFPWFVKGLDSGLFHLEGLVRLLRSWLRTDWQLFVLSEFLLLFHPCSDEEEEDDVTTPKPPVEPEEEKTLTKDEESDITGTLT